MRTRPANIAENKRKMKDSDNKISGEKRVIRKMIELYCVANHESKKNHFCPECEKLVSYSFERIDACPFKDTKTFCTSCVVHCYTPEMRERIRSVMRYSGPRMIFHHPIIAIKHLRATLQDKQNARQP